MTTLGTPAEAIFATSARLHADLIVVGTHGLSGARKLFLGLTTDKVLRASGVPALAIPASCSSPPRGWPGRFLVALDLDDATAAEMDAAARLAEAFESPLLAGHVLPPIALPPWLRGNKAAYNRARVGQAQASLLRLSLPASRRISGRVLIGDPGRVDRGTCRGGARRSADAAGQRRAGFLQPRNDAMAYRVLCYAPAPILTLPDGFTRAKRAHADADRSRNRGTKRLGS